MQHKQKQIKEIKKNNVGGLEAPQSKQTSHQKQTLKKEQVHTNICVWKLWPEDRKSVKWAVVRCPT